MTCGVAPMEVRFPESDDGAMLLDFECGHLFAVAEDVQAAVFEGGLLPGGDAP